jgi:hypothetical protein
MGAAMTHNEQLMADWCVGCKERIGSSQITSILPSEVPDWAKVLIIITVLAGVALFAARW